MTISGCSQFLHDVTIVNDILNDVIIINGWSVFIQIIKLQSTGSRSVLQKRCNILLGSLIIGNQNIFEDNIPGGVGWQIYS